MAPGQLFVAMWQLQAWSGQARLVIIHSNDTFWNIHSWLKKITSQGKFWFRGFGGRFRPNQRHSALQRSKTFANIEEAAPKHEIFVWTLGWLFNQPLAVKTSLVGGIPTLYQWWSFNMPDAHCCLIVSGPHVSAAVGSLPSFGCQAFWQYVSFKLYLGVNWVEIGIIGS